MYTRKQSVYNRVAFMVLAVIAELSLAPIVLLVISSFTDSEILVKNGYRFLPAKWSLDAYKYILQSYETIVKSYAMSFLVTFLGTSISLIFTSMLAYTLSKDDLPFGKVLSFFVFFTMIFNGGLVPTYLLYTNYFHVNDTILALIIPNLLVRAYYVILIRN